MTMLNSDCAAWWLSLSFVAGGTTDEDSCPITVGDSGTDQHSEANRSPNGHDVLCVADRRLLCADDDVLRRRSLSRRVGIVRSARDDLLRTDHHVLRAGDNRLLRPDDYVLRARRHGLLSARSPRLVRMALAELLEESPNRHAVLSEDRCFSLI